ncbi:hypothetical protein BVY03_03275 [bacterium K02(2017)]|nr:hypothetical protein BVY03_03275 [bacterium K02(2017)]
MKYKKYILTSFFVLFLSACAQSGGIFPQINLNTTEALAKFPNPINIVVDETNSQILVVNSNVDVLFNSGSLAVLSVNASNVGAPTLTATSVIETPNYAGEAFFDGVSSVYIPFRAESATNTAVDQFNKYSLTANSVTETIAGTVSSDPFGVSGLGGLIYVVSNNVLELYDANLALQSSVDLTAAETANINDSSGVNVLTVALDATFNLGLVSNPGGRTMIIDLATNAIRQVIEGPLSTRNIIIDGNGIAYILDSVTETIWVFDLSLLPAPTGATPQNVDDSNFLLGAVKVGSGPNGMVLDAANNRLYVGNFNDDSISVVDTLSLQEVDRFSLKQADISTNFLRECDGPFDLKMGTFNSTSYLFVACFLSHNVAIISPLSLNVLTMFPNTVLD